MRINTLLQFFSGPIGLRLQWTSSDLVRKRTNICDED